MTMTADAPAAPGAATTTAPPRLADGVELIGEFEGSGYKEAPSLVRRGDGQVIQLTPLLFTVAEKADGARDYAALAEAVGQEIGRSVTPDNVRFLVEDRLAPLGVLTKPDGSEPAVKKLDPLLALKFRTAVIPEGVANVLARVFMPLFHAPIAAAVVLGVVAADAWLFLDHGVAQAMRESVYNPGLFLGLFAAIVASAAFHEIGHAAACRFGGGEPGRMGCGLYLAWPAFYTDVTDSYRLGKRARLRTDLGGVYFNLVIVLLTIGGYLLTSFEPLLLLVVVQHFEIVHQLLPIVRLDGYYIVADMTGVPDLFNRIRPILQSLVPGKKPDERVLVLKRWVRIAVTAWVLIVVPLLLVQLVIMLIHLPRILGTAFDSAGQQWDAASKAFSDGNVLSGAASVFQLIVLALPMVGILLMLVRLAQKAGTWAWRRTDGRPVMRGGAVLAAAGLAAVLAMAWIPPDNYRPIKPGEKGTLVEGVSAVRRLPDGDAPLESERRAFQESEGSTDLGTDPADADPAESTTTTTVVTESDATDGDGTPTTSTTVDDTTDTTAESTTTTTSGAESSG